YDVTIAGGANGATAVSGRRLARAYAFTFTTPTVRLLQTNWYRLNGRFDQRVILPLRFNQPVRAADVLAHISARDQQQEWVAPIVSDAARARMGAAEAARFDAKVAAVTNTVNSQAAIPLRIAQDWDRQRFPPSPDLVVLETVSPPASDGWMRIAIDARMPAAQGTAPPPTLQEHVLQIQRPY